MIGRTESVVRRISALQASIVRGSHPSRGFVTSRGGGRYASRLLSRLQPTTPGSSYSFVLGSPDDLPIPAPCLAALRSAALAWLPGGAVAGGAGAASAAGATATTRADQPGWATVAAIPAICAVSRPRVAAGAAATAVAAVAERDGLPANACRPAGPAAVAGGDGAAGDGPGVAAGAASPTVTARAERDGPAGPTCAAAPTDVACGDGAVGDGPS